MKRLRPDYYEHFTCIAGSCPITCCQEWKIAVDDDTARHWKKLAPPADVEEQKKNLNAYTIHKDGERVIGLTPEHKCPFLNQDKLCKLVCAYDDTVLSRTCQDFPREILRFRTHEEESLMAACPAVLDIWLELKTLSFPSPAPEDLPSDRARLLFRLRSESIRLLDVSLQAQDKVTPAQALLELSYILQELNRADTLDDAHITEYFSDGSRAQLRDAISNIDLPPLDTLDECNELLQDLAVNYRKEGLYSGYLEPIIRLAEELSDGYDEEELLRGWDAFRQDFTVWRPLLFHYLENELYSGLLLPGSDLTLTTLLLHLEWIVLTYAVIRHSLFLAWLQDNKQPLSYETVRNYIVILNRMTGYNEDDVLEYLENSFEDPLWDWGYFALILGR